MYTKFLSLALSFALALSSLSYVNPASAQRVKNCDSELGPVHPSCKPDEEPPPDDPLTLPECDVALCIASVGKWHPATARLYAEQFGEDGVDGNYTEVSHSEFGDILAVLQGAPNFDALCTAYDVLVFEWNSPNIKNLTWQSLVDYMTCGGGVIFEDPTNVELTRLLREFDEKLIQQK